jgi:RND family efflux transporter MFP subunit
MNGAILTKRARTTMVLALPPADANPSDVPPTPAGSRVRKLAWAGVVLAFLSAAAYFRYQATSHAAEESARDQTVVREVTVAKSHLAAGGAIVLPATVQAYQATDLFARANGFLKVWRVDIGASVKAGQVIALIETPELDQELNQAIASFKQGQAEHPQPVTELEEGKAELALAEANVQKAKAHLVFSVNQLQRFARLWTSQSVSREEYDGVIRDREARNAELESAKADARRRKSNLDTREAIIANKKAMVRNREANVQRLRDLAGFKKVVAPFNGVITRRNAEIGMLVTSGSSGGTRPLFSIAQIDLLRVQVAVPQSSALRMRPGDQAKVVVPEMPGKAFEAKVTRTAGAVDPSSRSLLVEIELPNPDRQLLPGVYAQIHFQTWSEQANLVVPAKSVLMRSSGPHVVIVSSDGAVRVQKVMLGRDSGTEVEVLIGLTGDERLVVNPSDDLRDGQVVSVAESNTALVQNSRK